MVLLDGGINRIRDLLATDLEKGELGTGTNAALSTDTELQSPASSSIQTLVITKADKQVTASYTNTSASSPLDTWTEFKNYSDTNSVNYDRTVFTGFTQDTTKDFIVIKRYFIRRN